MKTSSASLPEQQQALRQRMHMQRALIAQLMQPIEPAPGDFPRSLTMRFFSEHPGLAPRLLAQAATLVVGGRLLRTVSMALLLGRVVRSLTNQRG